ncbi:MAG: hypothetical protein AAB693_02610 [Patescibacteria group bacterium]
MTRKIILIGGAPTTGKSTMANLVAKHFNIPWISTDQIREIMRLVASRDKYPKLFSTGKYTAEEFLTKFSAKQIVTMEFEQSEEVWPGIRKFIKQNYTWKDGFVIEGVNILPHLIAKDFANDKDLKFIFLINEDAKKIRNAIFTRGLWGDANTYPDSIKEKEIEWVLSFGHKLKLEIEKYKYPCVEVKKNNDDLQLVLSALCD